MLLIYKSIATDNYVRREVSRQNGTALEIMTSGFLLQMYYLTGVLANSITTCKNLSTVTSIPECYNILRTL
jgi:hypothetical protein